AAIGPLARAGAAVTFDPDRRKVVVFGGVAGGAAFGDTWEYDVATRAWSQRATSGPAGRAYASIAFDPSQHRVVLAGGASPNGAVEADAWTWDGNAWERQAISGLGPSLRFGAPMAWLPSRARLVLFGGAAAEMPRVGAPLG